MSKPNTVESGYIGTIIMNPLPGNAATQQSVTLKRRPYTEGNFLVLSHMDGNEEMLPSTSIWSASFKSIAILQAESEAAFRAQQAQTQASTKEVEKSPATDGVSHETGQ